jgi:hypothetical protein
MPNTPSYILYHGRNTGKDKDGKKIWTRIGAVWPNKSGKGFNISWDYLEWHSVKRNIFYINPLRRIIPHAFPGRPLRLAGQSSLDSPGVQSALLDGQYSDQVGLASPKRYAG